MPGYLLTIFLLAAGGAAGARYWFGVLVRTLQGAVAFPWATFAINVLGSVALGFAAAFFRGHPDPSHRNWYLLLGTGFCGGFTTFSAFSLETLELLQEGRPVAASAYALGSVAAGVLGVWLALKVGGGKLM